MNNVEKVEKRWDGSAAGFSELIREELEEGRTQRDAWAELILAQAPGEGRLDILDVGTGPGFFAILLSLAGHRLTGIDCSADMLEQARFRSSRYGIEPRFLQADAHKTPFPDNQFDMIVSRNVTWTLYQPEEAFREWLRILKPGGRLLYFDANWQHDILPKEQQELIQKDRMEYTELYGEPEETFRGDKQTENDFENLLVLTKLLRPDWDRDALPRFGYENIRINPRVNERVNSPKLAVLNRHIPVFMITADKPR